MNKIENIEVDRDHRICIATSGISLHPISLQAEFTVYYLITSFLDEIIVNFTLILSWYHFMYMCTYCVIFAVHGSLSFVEIGICSLTHCMPGDKMATLKI